MFQLKLGLTLGMAKKYVDDLSDNVKRGHRAKLAQGWFPGFVGLAYLNELATKTIIADPDRFPLLRRAVDLILGGHPPMTVLRTLNSEWGFRTRKLKRCGDKPLSVSAFYRFLSNPFYYGLIDRAGETHWGAHPPLMTKDEFDRIQEILGRPNRGDRARHVFAFTGLIRCAECGCMVTAEHQTNRYGSKYIYYHCTKRRGRSSQRTLRAERLEEQFQGVLAQIHIDDEFRDWALARLQRVHEREWRARQAARDAVRSAASGVQEKIQGLLDLRLRGLVTDEEFAAKKRDLVTEQLQLRERLGHEDGSALQWFEPAQRAFIFANEAPKRFGSASGAGKREIVLTLGSNFSLSDRVLRVEAKKPFHLLRERLATNRHLGVVVGIRTFFQEHPNSIAWPAFCTARREPPVTQSNT